MIAALWTTGSPFCRIDRGANLGQRQSLRSTEPFFNPPKGNAQEVGNTDCSREAVDLMAFRVDNYLMGLQ